MKLPWMVDLDHLRVNSARALSEGVCSVDCFCHWALETIVFEIPGLYQTGRYQDGEIMGDMAIVAKISSFCVHLNL